MEARLARLEAHMEHVQTDLAGLKQDFASVDGRLRSVETGLATLTERVAHLPSKGFIVSALGTALAVIAAMLAFQDQIKSLIGQ